MDAPATERWQGPISPNATLRTRAIQGAHLPNAVGSTADPKRRNAPCAGQWIMCPCLNENGIHPLGPPPMTGQAKPSISGHAGLERPYRSSNREANMSGKHKRRNTNFFDANKLATMPTFNETWSSPCCPVHGKISVLRKGEIRFGYAQMYYKSGTHQGV